MPASSPRLAWTVPLRVVLGVLAIAGVVTEVVWRRQLGFGSPALALIYPLVAIPVGHAAQKLATREAREPSTSEGFLAGSVVLAALYLLLLGLKLIAVFPFVAAALAAASLRVYPVRALLAQRVSLGSVALHLLVFYLAVRNSAYTDHLPLAEKAPRVFGWVDTSFWLNNAYGIERGLPVRDILVSDATLNYHWGASLVVVCIRALTGLPMHLAQFAALAACCWALAGILSRAAVRIIGAREGGLTAWCAIFIALAWEQKIIFNYPSAYATPLAVYLLVRFQAFRSPWAALLLVPGMTLLMITKEVSFLFVGALAGMMSLPVLLKERKDRRAWLRLAVLAGSAVVAKVCYGRLVEHGQKASFTFFEEHFSLGWFRMVFVQEGYGINGPLAGSPGFHAATLWSLVLTVAVAIWAYRSRRAEPRRAWILASSVLVYAIGFVMLLALKPHHTPEYDAQHASWVMGDMHQFLLNAEDIVMVTAALVGVATLEAAVPAPFPRPVTAVFVAALAFYDLTHTFTAPDPGGKDAGFEALEHVEPQGTLIACFVPPWSWYPFNEVPDLAGYFGHRFYFLRHGRWTTAHPRREELEKNQMLLVSSPTRPEAVAVARKEGVTHVMVFPGAIPGWLLGQTPVHKNERWAVFDVRPLL